MSSTLISTSPVVVLAPADCANTAAATSGWIDVRGYEGDIAFIQATGVVTDGTLVGKIQDATTSTGTGAADITGLAFASVGTDTDNDVQKLVIRASSTRGFVRYVGTIVTGPALVGVSMLARRESV